MDYVSKYVEFLKKQAEIKRPLRIVCDASNGTAGIILEKLNGIPNLELILINTTPDPEFPAHGPNPLVTDATNMLVKKVLEVDADFGVIFDADGDRIFFVDNEGRLLPSFVISAILFSYSTSPFVADELIYLSLTTSGIFNDQDIIPSRVGTFFIKENMLKNNATLGAEFSGHFYFKDFFGNDSGIFAMIYIANILAQQEKSLADLSAEFSWQTLLNTDLPLKETSWNKLSESIKNQTSAIAKGYFEREGLTIITENGWINVRLSNTEPLLRIYVGSKTKELAEADLSMVIKIVKNTKDTDERAR